MTREKFLREELEACESSMRTVIKHWKDDSRDKQHLINGLELRLINLSYTLDQLFSERNHEDV